MMILLYLALNAFAIQNGDILLQPLDCYSCNLIEDEEDSIYSHSGIVIKKDKEFFVAEALGKVSLVPLNEFLARTQKNQKVLVLRHKDFHSRLTYYFKKSVKSMLGFKFDHDMLWTNVDDEGNEELYCSEFVWKVLNDLDLSLPKPKKMKFQVNRDAWDRYFKNQTPVNELGVSPQDFANFKDFIIIEEL